MLDFSSVVDYVDNEVVCSLDERSTLHVMIIPHVVEVDINSDGAWGLRPDAVQ